MRNKIAKAIAQASFFAFLMLCISSKLWAVSSTIYFEAAVTEVIDGSVVLNGNVSVGDKIRGSYTYNINAQNTSGKQDAGQYQFESKPNGVKLEINGITMETEYGVSNKNGFIIFISNNYNGRKSDSYLFQSYENKTNLQSALVEYIFLELIDYRGSAIDNIDLTAMPPGIGDWSERRITIALCTDFVDPCSGEFVKITSVVTALSSSPIVAPLVCDPQKSVYDITKPPYNAVPNSTQHVLENTAGIQLAVDSACDGDTIFIPKGLFRINKTIVVDKNLNFSGESSWSGIFQTNGHVDLLRVGENCGSTCAAGVNGITVSDLFLGSVNAGVDPVITPSGPIISNDAPSLLNLRHVHRSEFKNLILQGSHTGMLIRGSLANTFTNIRSGQNTRRFKIEECLDRVTETTHRCWNTQWIELRGEDQIASNANVIIKPVLEGGKHGIKYTGFRGQGGLHISGGVISVRGEHQKGAAHEPGDDHMIGKAIEIVNNSHPVTISGLHIEGGNIELRAGRLVSIRNSFITGGISGPGGGAVVIKGYPHPNNNEMVLKSRDVVLDSLLLDDVYIGSNAVRTKLSNISYAVSGTGDINDSAIDTYHLNVVRNSAAEGTQASTFGFGTRNPDYTQSGDRILLKGALGSVP